jgi:hypothetical protein
VILASFYHHPKKIDDLNELIKKNKRQITFFSEYSTVETGRTT